MDALTREPCLLPPPPLAPVDAALLCVLVTAAIALRSGLAGCAAVRQAALQREANQIIRSCMSEVVRREYAVWRDGPARAGVSCVTVRPWSMPLSCCAQKECPTVHVVTVWHASTLVSTRRLWIFRRQDGAGRGDAGQCPLDLARYQKLVDELTRRAAG